MSGMGCRFNRSMQLSFSHAVWHLFVLAGGVCHFFAVIWYVLPVRQALPISG